MFHMDQAKERNTTLLGLPATPRHKVRNNCRQDYTANRWYCVYSLWDPIKFKILSKFGFSRPAVAPDATNNVKFGIEEPTFSSLRTCELNSQWFKTAADGKFGNWTCFEYLKTVLSGHRHQFTSRRRYSSSVANGTEVGRWRQDTQKANICMLWGRR